METNTWEQNTTTLQPQQQQLYLVRFWPVVHLFIYLFIVAADRAELVVDSGDTVKCDTIGARPHRGYIGE